MRDYKWLHEYCLNRFGSVAALEARLPTPLSPAQLRKIIDRSSAYGARLIRYLRDLF